MFLKQKMQRTVAKVMREQMRGFAVLADYHSRPYLTKYGWDAEGGELLVRIQEHAVEHGLPFAEAGLREAIDRTGMADARDYEVEMRFLLERGIVYFDFEMKTIDLVAMEPVFAEDVAIPGRYNFVWN